MFLRSVLAQVLENMVHAIMPEMSSNVPKLTQVIFFQVWRRDTAVFSHMISEGSLASFMFACSLNMSWSASSRSAVDERKRNLRHRSTASCVSNVT